MPNAEIINRHTGGTPAVMLGGSQHDCVRERRGRSQRGPAGAWMQSCCRDYENSREPQIGTGDIPLPGIGWERFSDSEIRDPDSRWRTGNHRPGGWVGKCAGDIVPGDFYNGGIIIFRSYLLGFLGTVTQVSGVAVGVLLAWGLPTDDKLWAIAPALGLVIWGGYLSYVSEHTQKTYGGD